MPSPLHGTVNQRGHANAWQEVPDRFLSTVVEQRSEFVPEHGLGPDGRVMWGEQLENVTVRGEIPAASGPRHHSVPTSPSSQSQIPRLRSPRAA